MVTLPAGAGFVTIAGVTVTVSVTGAAVVEGFVSEATARVTRPDTTTASNGADVEGGVGPVTAVAGDHMVGADGQRGNGERAARGPVAPDGRAAQDRRAFRERQRPRDGAAIPARDQRPDTQLGTTSGRTTRATDGRRGHTRHRLDELWGDRAGEQRIARIGRGDGMVPTLRLDVASSADPSETATEPSTVAPSVNVTVPEGTPAAVIDAVNVTVAPTATGFTSATSATDVGSAFTVWVNGSDTEPPWVESPS